MQNTWTDTGVERAPSSTGTQGSGTARPHALGYRLSPRPQVLLIPAPWVPAPWVPFISMPVGNIGSSQPIPRPVFNALSQSWNINT